MKLIQINSELVSTVTFTPAKKSSLRTFLVSDERYEMYVRTEKRLAKYRRRIIEHAKKQAVINRKGEIVFKAS